MMRVRELLAATCDVVASVGDHLVRRAQDDVRRARDDGAPPERIKELEAEVERLRRSFATLRTILGGGRR